MTFKTAFSIAIGNNEFRKFYEKVKNAEEKGTETGCMLFSIGNEVFYYGFDGVDLHQGKHSAKRSEYLLKMQKVMKI